MAIRPDWNIGKINLVAGSAEFVTVNAMLNMSAVEPGDVIITPSGHILVIKEITGANSGTLMLPCPAGAAGTELPLRIRFQPDGSRVAGALRAASALLSGGNVEALAGLVGQDGKIPIFTGSGTMGLVDASGFETDLSEVEEAINNRVRFDAAQDLNASQQNQARQNINAQQAGSTLEALRSASGASANQLPYMISDTEAAFTSISPLARSLISHNDGWSMWDTMGGFASTSIILFPSGVRLYRGVGALPSNGYATIPFPTAFPNNCYGVVTSVRDAAGAFYTYTLTTSDITKTSFYATGHSVQDGGIVALAGITFYWIAWGD